MADRTRNLHHRLAPERPERPVLRADYANWGSQFYTTQVSLGAPRSAEVELGFGF